MTLRDKAIGRLTRPPRLAYLILMHRALQNPLPDYPARVPFDWQILPAEAGEVERQLAHLPAEHRSDIGQRLARGHLCCVARHEGTIIWVSWIGVGTSYSYSLDREYPLATGVVSNYGAYTLPAFRGLGVHSAGTFCQLRALQCRGFEHLLHFIEPSNRSAMRVSEKFDCRRVGVTGLVEVFGLRWYFHRERRALTALTARHYWRKV